LWTAGVKAPPLGTGAQQDRAGRIIVNKDLTIPGHPDILVTGDMMSLDKLPGLAEVASIKRHQITLRCSSKMQQPGRLTPTLTDLI
jgi:NADH dehydrogenase FAD-containing subunit